MKFKVLKDMTRRSEGMKAYKAGSEIELNDTESKDLLEYGFIEKTAEPKKATPKKAKK